MQSKQPGADTMPRFSASRKSLPLDMLILLATLRWPSRQRHSDGGSLPGIEFAPQVIIVMPLHAAANRARLDTAVPNRPARGQPPGVGPGQPQAKQGALAVGIGMIFKAGARVKHCLVAQDLEVAW